MERDESVIVFDSHGQLIDNIIRRMPARQLTDTYHLDLKDREYPFTLNVFACADPENEEERDRTRNRVMQAFEKLWPATQRGVYFKELLRHIIILLIEKPWAKRSPMFRSCCGMKCTGSATSAVCETSAAGISGNMTMEH